MAYYKTGKHPKHYHMKEGCCGATIPCSADNLQPCSICCGSKSSEGGQAQGGTSEGAGTSPSGAGSYSYSDSQSPDYGTPFEGFNHVKQGGPDEVSIPRTRDGVMEFAAFQAMTDELRKIEREHLARGVGLGRESFTDEEIERIRQAAKKQFRKTEKFIREAEERLSHDEDIFDVLKDYSYRTRMSEFVNGNPRVDAHLLDSRCVPDPENLSLESLDQRLRQLEYNQINAKTVLSYLKEIKNEIKKGNAPQEEHPFKIRTLVPTLLSSWGVISLVEVATNIGAGMMAGKPITELVSNQGTENVVLNPDFFNPFIPPKEALIAGSIATALALAYALTQKHKNKRIKNTAARDTAPEYGASPPYPQNV